MNRRSLFLLVPFLVLGVLFSGAFGWIVANTIQGGIRFGRFGEIAVRVASFPSQVEYSLRYIFWKPEEDFKMERPSIDVGKFHPVRMKPGIHVDGLVVRENKPALGRASGWRIVVGHFLIDGQLTAAALALTPELEVVKVWKFSDEVVAGRRPEGTSLKIPDGFAITKDGSAIVTFTVGISIQRFDKCGNRVWSTGGAFNHSVTLDETEQYIWTINGWDKETEIVKLSTETGQIVRRAKITEIIEANQEIDILDIMKMDRAETNSRDPADMFWLPDPFHINDVDPLPSTIADAFEGFRAGDLLVSARSLNLVFVVDPETLKVKWWHSGSWRRQHDPDWNPAGKITVYDNRMGRDYSRIVGIDLASRRTHVIIDGSTTDFYSREAGKHTITDSGNILVSSMMQGRVFEVDSNGDVVFDMFNTASRDVKSVYFLTQILWFPTEKFDFSKDLLCVN